MAFQAANAGFRNQFDSALFYISAAKNVIAISLSLFDTTYDTG
jgi:hypothetical protein